MPDKLSNPISKPRSFAEKLKEQMAAREMGARTLAKLMNPENVEHQRRAIRRWLRDAHTPNQASRDSVTDALGLERGVLDPDKEEDALRSVLGMVEELHSSIRAQLAEREVAA